MSKALLQVYHGGYTLGPIGQSLYVQPLPHLLLVTILRSGNIRMCNPCLIVGFVVAVKVELLLQWIPA